MWRTHLECEQRAEVDDLAAPLCDHVLPGGLREQPDRLEVDVQDLQTALSVYTISEIAVGKSGV